MRHFVLALFISAGLQGAAAADDYGQALDALKAHSTGFGIKDAKDARAAQDALWQAAQQWTIRYLDAHPNAAPKDLAEASKGSDRPQLSAIVLDAKTFLVATQFGETGNVFAVAREAHGFAVVWDIAKAVPPKRFPQLRAWSVEGAARTCGPRYLYREWNECGPVYASFLRLPDDAAGHPRFAIDGTYAMEAGVSLSKLVSLWRWNGHDAEFLLANQYEDTLDDAAGTRVEGGKLRVREQHDFKSASATAVDPGRATDWAVALDPNEVRPLGREEVFPETALIDDAMMARIEGRNDPHLTPKAVKALDAILATRPVSGDDSLGQLMGNVTLHEGRMTRVCFNTDDLGPLWFSLIPKGATFSIVDVVRSKHVDCTVDKGK
ncbi:MAG TPA: hypothetical protein VHZ29_06835 [Rhizomicrobium sp.]|jgi:hypothetical protein|nr:hypothetical protein [Rhizomicrobium sp.]